MLKLGEYSSTHLRERLARIEIDGAGGLAGYAEEATERFIRTLDLIPTVAVDVLEIGANPYFQTILAKWFRPELRFAMTNYFGGELRKITQVAVLPGLNGNIESHIFDSTNVNIESGTLPFADSSFDCVLFCEVIEHLTNDPLPALSEIRRVLRPSGSLVLTTPNVARLENVARLLGGHNIYDPYSGHGPYGRHNREYTKHELSLLLRHCGFVPEILSTHDIHPNLARDYFPDLEKISGLLDFRSQDLGQYHFTRSSRDGVPKLGRPSWLYRSYSAADLV